MFRSLNLGQSVFAKHGGRWSRRSRRKALTGNSRSGRRAGAAQAPAKKSRGPPSPHTIALGHLSRIGLAPGAGTPNDKADMRESGISEPYRRPLSSSMWRQLRRLGDAIKEQTGPGGFLPFASGFPRSCPQTGITRAPNSQPATRVSIIISPPTIRAILAQRYPPVCGLIEQPGVASELLWLVPADLR